MNEVRVVQLIATSLSLRGKGVEGDPYRRVIEFWTMDGTKIADLDIEKDRSWYEATSRALGL